MVEHGDADVLFSLNAGDGGTVRLDGRTHAPSDQVIALVDALLDDLGDLRELGWDLALRGPAGEALHAWRRLPDS
jgi:hypothetical protein